MKKIIYTITLISIFASNALAVEVLPLKGLDHEISLLNQIQHEIKNTNTSIKKHNFLIQETIDNLISTVDNPAKGVEIANKAIDSLTELSNLHPFNFTTAEWRYFDYKKCNIGEKQGEMLINDLIGELKVACSDIYKTCTPSRKSMKLYRENQLGKTNDICIGIAKTDIKLESDPLIKKIEDQIVQLKQARTYFSERKLNKGNLYLTKVFDELLDLKQ